jgi:hypothetical protein
MNPKTQKAIAIMNTTLNTAKTVMALSKEAFPKRRLFGKIDRRPLKRIKKKRAMAMLMMSVAMGASQIAIIASQPIPKFPSGSAINDNSQAQ